ncbi:hypothetical protein [Pseudoxanthomonas sp. Root630]|uniref:hypothetical protein n=1 Tax=Pseudoxanthomonas sp. Root630 TaxID=1736574 RepID=UPI000702B6AC|nr:hypothetical protein [Pseudoxanthomonas sp. Root630]KRA42982.1 hypothetical protein ASD72_13050 [Pseudoxanthomonas sp. Root630]
MNPVPGTGDGPLFHIEFVTVDYGLRAWATGINGTLDTTLACWRTIAEEVRRVRPKGLLVVDDMEGEPPPPGQLLEFVQAMQGQGMEAVRIAYVERHTQQIPQVEFAGLLANEHGFHAQIFGDEAAAVIWLRYGGG